MADMDDYDEPDSYAFCPECGTSLIFDADFEGYEWFCDECEAFVKDGKLTDLPNDSCEMGADELDPP